MRISSLAVLVVAACAGSVGDNSSADDLAPAAVGSAPQAHIKHAIPLGGQSTVSLRTLPNAACNLRPTDEEPGASDNLRVYSDETGIARVNVMDTVGTPQTSTLALDCVDPGGHTFTHQIEVSAVAGARGQAPAPYSNPAAHRLPALDKDPMSLTAQELVARNYPPRPDPAKSAEHYQNWLSLIQARPTLVATHLTNEPGRSHGPIASQNASVTNGTATSSNWSGYVIATNGNVTPYGEVYGDWWVPQVYPEGGFWNSHHSSFWVGMDGWGTPDVVQDGTEENTYTYFWTQWTSYSAWVEWYPLNEQGVNLSVNPGDEIRAWTWVGTSNGTWTASGNVGWFYLWNVTQNTAAAYVSVTAPSGTVFNGHQAEWVMERPGVNGSTSTLANYGQATMTYPAALDFNGTWHWYSGDSTNYSANISMYNGSDLLSTVAPVNGNTMRFTWRNYQ